MQTIHILSLAEKDHEARAILNKAGVIDGPCWSTASGVAPCVLALVTNQSRASVVNALAGTVLVVLPSTTSITAIPAVAVTPLKSIAPTVTAADTFATALQKVNLSLLNPMSYFDPSHV